MKKQENKCLLITGIVTAVAIFVLFGRYLLNQYNFIFPTMVNDGITQFYPRYLEAARVFAEDAVFSYYSFANGFGGMQTMRNPFTMMIVLFGEEHVAYMIGIKYVLCVILSGTLFSLYLKEAKCGYSTCMLGGISYALSTQVIIGGCWQTQGELAVIAALTLLVIEKIYRGKKPVVGLLICLGLIYTCVDSYYFLLYGGLAVLYVLARFVYLNGKWERCKPRTKRIIVIAAGIGLLFAGFLFVSKFQGVFQSARFQDGLQDWGRQWKNTFSTENFHTIATAVFRTMSPNILGISMIENYQGAPFGWISEDPGFYVGLLPLLILTNVSELKKLRTSK